MEISACLPCFQHTTSDTYQISIFASVNKAFGQSYNSIFVHVHNMHQYVIGIALVLQIHNRTKSMPDTNDILTKNGCICIYNTNFNAVFPSTKWMKLADAAFFKYVHILGICNQPYRAPLAPYYTPQNTDIMQIKNRLVCKRRPFQRIL